MSLINKTINGYKITKRLGKGSFGEVFSGVSYDKTEVIIKFILTKKVDLIDIVNEIIVMRLLNFKCDNNNNYELCFLDAFHYKDYYCIVTRLLPNAVELDSIIDKHDISYKSYYKIMTVLVNQLDKMHYNNIIHKDIKAANVVVSFKENTPITNVTFIDFGLSCLEDKCSPGGTMIYMAPEMIGLMDKSINNDTIEKIKSDKKNFKLLNNKLTRYFNIYKMPLTEDDYKKTDVFSLGVLFFYMLNKDYPQNDDGDLFKYFLSKPSLIKSNYKSPSSKFNKCNKIIDKMLELDPIKRPSIRDVKKMFKEI